jgi:2-methylcitrate dehydratase PrpD
MHATQIFARFARQLAERPLPDKVVHHAQRAVIDWYASLYPGLDTPAAQVLEATLADDLDRGGAR